MGRRLRYNRSAFVFTGESMITTGSSIDLQGFLKLPEIDDSPAWELLDGHPKQKPMPTAYHSILQKRLVAIVDACESPYEAFPELRCLFGSYAIVPDIAVVRRNAMPTGNLPFSGAPAGIIEILSPNQSTTRLIAKIQTCLQAGGQLGWLVDPEEEVVMVMRSSDRFDLFQGGESLPVL